MVSLCMANLGLRATHVVDGFGTIPDIGDQGQFDGLEAWVGRLAGKI